ncbi:methylated-DNA--[protein]-cysteine S-methyltransferase [Propionibacteriaceae bacterium Y2011]
MTRHTVIDSPVGPLMLVADAESLSGCYFTPHQYPPDRIGERVAGDALFGSAASQLGEYFAGERTAFDFPLAPTGPDLHERVWRRLVEIPYGGRITYGELAVELGDRALAQSVGQAVGHNPISIIIPCHRVVGADGSMTGFAGGIPRKRYLLDLEGKDTLFPPEPPG